MIRFLSLIFIVSAFSNFSDAQSYKDTTFTNYFKMTPPGWIASDGAISLLLPDGRSMWMMGDSHINQTINANGEIPCLFNTRNSILVQDSSDLSGFETFYDATGTNTYSRQFVKMQNETGVTYWPASGTVREDTAYTFWLRYIQDTLPGINLLFTGMVVAKIKLPEIVITEVTPIQYPNIVYGMAIVWDSIDQYYYIYGRQLDFIIFKPILARSTYNNLLGDWEFYSGNNTWSENPTSAIPIASEASSQFSVFQLNEQYHLFYQKNGFLTCGLGRDMFIYSADDPWGPFSNPALVYTMEDTFSGQYPKTYNGQAHPQFTVNNELLISYNLNKTCPGPCAGNPFGQYNPDMYRPQFARVPLCMFANDIEKPIIVSQQSDVFIQVDTNCQAAIPDLTLNIIAADNCDSNLVITQSPVAGTIVSGETVTQVLIFVTDAAGNTAVDSLNVYVEDIGNPALTCESFTTHYIPAGTNEGFIDVPLANVSDNCGGSLAITNSFNAGGANASGIFPVGNTAVVYTTQDAAGNAATCTTTVLVIEQFGINCPQNIVVSADSGVCNALVTVPIVTLSSGVPPFSISNNFNNEGADASGSYPVGTTQVIFTSTDNDEAIAVCTAVVTVQDVIPPSISCPADVTVQVIQGTTLTQVNLALATAIDLCDANPIITNNFNAGGDNASGQYPPGLTNVVFAATDSSGNSSTCITAVNIVENPPLVIICPADISIDCAVDTYDLLLTGSSSVSGFGSDSATINYVDVVTTPNADCPQQFVISRTFTASEPGGQSVNCVQTITVTDTQTPTVVSKTGNVSLAGASSFNFTGFEIINLALSTDNCGTLQVESVTPASISQIAGCTTVILNVIVSDGCGNTISISEEVFVSNGTGEVEDATIGPDNIGYSLQEEHCIGLFEIEVSGQPTSKIDRMQIIYQEVCGDFELITRLDELEGPGWGGIIARENISSGSRKIALKAKLNGELRRDRRDVQGEPQASLLLTIPEAETWLRMVRSGNNWFLFSGSDGSNWTLRNSGFQTQSNCILAGVFTESEIVKVKPPVLSFKPIMTRGLFVNTVINLD